MSCDTDHSYALQEEPPTSLNDARSNCTQPVVNARAVIRVDTYLPTYAKFLLVVLRVGSSVERFTTDCQDRIETGEFRLVEAPGAEQKLGPPLTQCEPPYSNAEEFVND